MVTASVSSKELYVGGTYRFQSTIYKESSDTTPMDLTGATATLHLIDPDGVHHSCAGSIDSPPSGGTVHYDTLTTDLDRPGLWKRSWLIELGALSLPGDPVEFSVSEI